mmetsp:Transcript_28950/g.72672  ORF Transcript_28950/g.72672 Transcript_28950/m.72672 type:complete len:207 (+) Transcript_28950:2118-2738(+)
MGQPCSGGSRTGGGGSGSSNMPAECLASDRVRPESTREPICGLGGGCFLPLPLPLPLPAASPEAPVHSAYHSDARISSERAKRNRLTAAGAARYGHLERPSMEPRQAMRPAAKCSEEQAHAGQSWQSPLSMPSASRCASAMESVSMPAARGSTPLSSSPAFSWSKERLMHSASHRSSSGAMVCCSSLSRFSSSSSPVPCRTSPETS